MLCDEDTLNVTGSVFVESAPIFIHSDPVVVSEELAVAVHMALAGTVAFTLHDVAADMEHVTVPAHGNPELDEQALWTPWKAPDVFTYALHPPLPAHNHTPPVPWY